MKDFETRVAILKRLRKINQQKSDIKIFEEFTLHRGLARIDLIVVSDKLHGFEIKSDSDTLSRLEEQARYYSQILDKITLLVGHRHFFNALKIIPGWWGIKLIRVGSRGAIHFDEARNPRLNPSIDKLGLARLLWREEGLQFLSEIGQENGFKAKPHLAICEKISEIATLDQIRSKICWQLKRRQNWQPDLQ